MTKNTTASHHWAVTAVAMEMISRASSSPTRTSLTIRFPAVVEREAFASRSSTAVAVSVM